MAIGLKILNSKTIIDIFSLTCNNENYYLKRKVSMKLFCLLDDKNKAIILVVNY